MGGNDQNRAEKQNVVLTCFRPATRSSGHFGRRMLSTFCPPTIRATSLRFCRTRPELSVDNMYRACESKDQTLKQIRTLHSSDMRTPTVCVCARVQILCVLIVKREPPFLAKSSRSLANFSRCFLPIVANVCRILANFADFKKDKKGRTSPDRQNPPFETPPPFSGPRICTEQMDADGLGRKLLLIRPPRPPTTPEKQTLGTLTASHKMLTLQALSSSLHASTAKRGYLGRGEALGYLRQSVPQNSRVHLHIIDPI